mmetsp:Transcript_20855/g.37880  ORF Transcript_20855/g.37880 Transcript_20855/m.37880 type:complete len:305 (+) Transcript_20855:126-1040(+)
MLVKNEQDTVSFENAIAALREAETILSAYGDADSPWQDPVELLNKTAVALDEAALATRKDGGKNVSAQTSDEAATIKELSARVIKGRQSILDATQKVVAGSRPAELWNPNTLIVFASHTGTSREYALELQSHLKSADVMNINDLSLLDLQERKRVYFICSTFGLGRPPRDAEVVYATLQILSTVERAHDGDNKNDDLLVAAPEKEALVGLEVAVAALGNSKFSAFCQFGRDLADRLSALGAQEILPVTLLDSKNGKDEQTRRFREWERLVLEIEGVSEPEEKAIIPIENQNDFTSAESTCCSVL